MGPILMPPAQYAHPFPGKTLIHTMPLGEIQNHWNGTPPPPGQSIDAFSYLIDPSTCVLVLPRVEDVGQHYLDLLTQHETAHCNGWPYDHPGATLPSF